MAETKVFPSTFIASPKPLIASLLKPFTNSVAMFAPAWNMPITPKLPSKLFVTLFICFAFIFAMLELISLSILLVAEVAADTPAK